MDFILVRHVETTGNYEKRFSGITDVEYTEEGKKQSERLIQRLRDYQVDKIYSSPLSRAFIIAKKVGEDTSTPVEVIKELSEMNFGIFENLTFKEVTQKYNEHWLKWESDYFNYQIPKGDSLCIFHHRIIEFIDSIKRNEGRCMIVCHGGTIQSIITHLLHLEVKDRWHFSIPLGGIAEIEYQKDFGILKAFYSAIDHSFSDIDCYYQGSFI